jgi:hypothetical protein
MEEHESHDIDDFSRSRRPDFLRPIHGMQRPRPHPVYRLRNLGAVVVTILIFILAFGPEPVRDFLRGVANWWSLALVLGAAGTLLWFVYSICLRRLWRIRRIANIRLKRILEEREP